MINRLTNVFPYYHMIPENVDAVDWQNFSANGNDFVVDWVITREKRLIEDNMEFIYAMAGARLDANVGTGGSLARFKIVDQYLYVVDSHSIHIFDIKNLDNPNKLESIFAGFDIETIFSKEQFFLYGYMRGNFSFKQKFATILDGGLSIEEAM